MKNRIRRCVHNRRIRKFWKNAVTIFSCVVVFITTYALILPAITMEKDVNCGMEEHQHDESCYEERLVCGLEEKEAHHHTDQCYTVEKTLICTQEEHTHKEGCYDENGNLTCALTEHSHTDECYREDRILSCPLEETDGHTHTASCYKKVLTCSRPVHTHSVECYKDDADASEEEVDPASAEEEKNIGSSEEEKNTAAAEGEKSNASTEEEKNTVSADELKGSAAEKKEEAEQASAKNVKLEDYLTRETSLWYRQADADENDWKRITDDTVLGPDDIVLLYYAYCIPAGTLDSDNAVVRYPLPDSVRLTDRQIEIINTANDGLGAQAIEGRRSPEQEPAGEEYVSAWTKVENIMAEDVEEDAEKEDLLLEQDLILTFDSYTIDKNRDIYDENGNLTHRAEDVYGFLAIDINTDQIDFEEVSSEILTDTVDTDEGTIDRRIEKTLSEAEIIFVPEDREWNIDEISARVTLGKERVLEENPRTAEEDEDGDAHSDEQEADRGEEGGQSDDRNADVGEEGENSGTEPAGEGVEGGNSDSEDIGTAGTESRENGKEDSDEQFMAGELTFEGPDYTVIASFDKEAGIPTGSVLSVSEITQEDRSYQEYRDQAEKAATENTGEEKAAWVRLFDISIVKDGSIIEPAGPVSVQINYHEAMERPKNAEVKAVHFEGEKETPRVLGTEAEGSETSVEQVKFDTDSFSVFAIVGTVIEKNVLASDGKNYKVTVTYGAETGIPVDADLSVEEILPDENDDAGMSSAYDEYVSKTENALGMEEGSAGYIRLFDIKIVDKDDHEIKYQPAEGTTVDVRIELADSGSDCLSVVHFADAFDEGSVLDAETAGQVVSFTADGFSVYSVVSQESDTGATALDGQSYVLITNNNAMLMGTPHSIAGRLNSQRANPTVGGTLQVNGSVTAWTFEAVEGHPGWYYISDGNGNYINITSASGSGGSVTLGERQAIFVATRTTGGNTLYQLRNSQTGGKAVNNYNNNANDGFGAWNASSNANNDWFRLYGMEYLGDYQVIFDANGGNEPAPASVWGLEGDSFILPDYSGTRSGYEFLGWYTKSSLTDSPANYFTVYPPGSEYTIPDKDITLYAVWNQTANSTGEFYIRLDGTIPAEPGSYPNSAYTGAIQITGAIEQHTWVIDNDVTKQSNGLYVENEVTARLNQMPNIDQLVQNINSNSGKIGFKVENRNGEIVVSEITNASTNSRYYNVAVGEGLYVLWYVQKPTSSAWHIDGVLLKKSSVNVSYNGNTPDGSARNVPLGYQVDVETSIKIGAEGSPNGTQKTPTRPGYRFVGWNTKPDGSGEAFINNQDYVVHNDVTFYAQWSKGTNLMTVSKTNDDGEVLAGASFKLEEKTVGGFIEKANRTTNESGIFTYDQLENDTLYRMTETYAPNGYEVQNAFFFKVAVDGAALELKVCDEDGSYIEEPDWLRIEYIPAEDPLAQGVARIRFNIRDERIKRSIKFIKTDEAGNPLPGAEYTLTNAGGNVINNFLKEASDGLGVFSVDNAVLPYGTYILTEDKAPVTYAVSQPVTFTLNDYVSGADTGLTIVSGDAAAECEVTSETVEGLTITTYAYTVTVRDKEQAHIIVTKNIEVDGDLNPDDLDTTIYYALTKKGTEGYVTKDSGELWIESMDIVNGVPTPDRVIFDGIEFGQYDVWEMALIDGEYTRMYNGLVAGGNFQLDSVSAFSQDGGNNANVSADDLEAEVDFINHYGNITQSTSFTAHKKWTDRAGNEISPPEGATIEFTLYSEKKDASGQVIENTQQEVRSIELDGVHDPDGEDTPWTAVFKYLPVYDENNLEYVYKVKETVTVDGYYPNEYPQEYYLTSSGGTITNRELKTDVELHKHFEIYPENADLPGAAEGLAFTLTLPDQTTQSFTLADFAPSAEDSNDYVLTLHDLPLGAYSFTEAGQENLFSEAGYNLIYSVSSAEGEAEVGSPQEQPVLQLELQNNYAKSGMLIVRKNSILHEAVDETTVPEEISGKEFLFVVRRGSLYLQENGTLGTTPYVFTLTEGTAKEFASVPAGQYTVIEQDSTVEGYLWEVIDGTRAADGTWSKTLTISDAEDAGEASFDNRYTKIENGSLTVSKTVAGGPEEAGTKAYKVEIKTTRHQDETVWLDADGNLTTEKTILSVTAGQPLVFPTVPAGTYTVTEDETDAAFTDYALQVTYSKESPFTIHKDGQEEVQIINTYNYLYTPVKITKTVTGNMGDKNLYFGFDAYVTDAEGQPVVVEGVTNSNGLIRFSLKDGEEKLLEKLPKGANLRIVEYNKNYETTISGKVGVGENMTETDLTAAVVHSEAGVETTVAYSFVIPDEGATVAFTNDRTVEQSVILKKIGYNNTDDSTWDLAGATFWIYEDEEKTKPVVLSEMTEFTSGEDGVIYAGKLEAGTYYLDETSVPAGYNAPVGLFILNVGVDDISLNSTAVIGSPDLNSWITSEESPETGEVIYTVSIRNTTGVSLPSTGGPGTNLIYLIGILLTCIAGAGLMTRKRRRDAA